MALVYFKALSDETRLRLVHILLHYELSVNELVRILGMGQSRVSRHLKILTEAGLLTSRRDGLWVFYAATRCGEASDFLQAMGPFLHTDTAMREDLAMAAQILEERALKTRQFFNAIAEDWDELNREVLEDFDLPAAVLAADGGGEQLAAKHILSRADDPPGLGICHFHGGRRCAERVVQLDSAQQCGNARSEAAVVIIAV